MKLLSLPLQHVLPCILGEILLASRALAGPGTVCIWPVILTICVTPSPCTLCNCLHYVASSCFYWRIDGVCFSCMPACIHHCHFHTCMERERFFFTYSNLDKKWGNCVMGLGLESNLYLFNNCWIIKIKENFFKIGEITLYICGTGSSYSFFKE